MPLRPSLPLLATILAAVIAPAGAQPPQGGAGTGQGGQRTPPRAMRPGDEAPRGTAVLRGFVVAADTGAPIRRAQVRVLAPEAQDTRITTTDEQGRFELKELVGGRYTVTASKGGFVTLQYGQRRPSERGTPVDLPAGQTLEKLDDRAAARQRHRRPHRRRVRRAADRRAGAGAALRLRQRRAAAAAGRPERSHRRSGVVPRVRPAARRIRTSSATLRDDRGPATAAADRRRRAVDRLRAHLLPRHDQRRRRPARHRGPRRRK